MKFPVTWLADYLDVSLDPQALAQDLTRLGLEVEEESNGATGACLELGITPNRGDCLSIHGIAREWQALHGQGAVPALTMPQAHAGAAEVSITATDRCFVYCGQLMEGITVQPSPQWLQDRLIDCGLRPINNVVDATNYILLETGQPLHAFDRQRLSSAALTVRLAQAGEAFESLDGQHLSLTTADLVIADSNGPVALAGVMGGALSGVTEQTQQVFLESAFFEPSGVRLTSRKYGMQTDSSYRFERGVDPAMTGFALERLKNLLMEIAGAVPVGEPTVQLTRPCEPRSIALRFAKVSARLGGTWTTEEVEHHLTRLGCVLSEVTAGEWQVLVPPHRHDLAIEVDLIEELMRMRGYDALEGQLPPVLNRQPERGAKQHLSELLKQHLVTLGFNETIHMSFYPEDELSWPGADWAEQFIALANPLSQAGAYLRPTLLFDLAQRAVYHHKRQMPDVCFFEQRTVFRNHGADGLRESAMLAGILAGEFSAHWSAQDRSMDFYDVKGVLESLLQVAGRGDVSWADLPVDDFYYNLLEPTQAAVLLSEGQVVGRCGRLSSRALHALDGESALWVFELDWAWLLGSQAQLQFSSYSNFPNISKDLSVVVKEKVQYESLRNQLQEKALKSLKSIDLFDVYRGEGLPSGHKSLSLRFTYSDPQRTLNDAEVQENFEEIIDFLKKHLQATIRS